MRIAQHISILLVSITITSTSCNRPAPSPETAPGKITAPALTATAHSDSTRNEIQTFANNFFATGNATSEQLTIEFKKVIAPPVFDFEKEQGYSDSVAKQWLKGLPNLNPAEAFPIIIAGTEASAVAFVEVPRIGRVRLIRDSNGWKVDWLQSSSNVIGLDGSMSEDELGARFAASAWIDAALAKQYPRAKALFSAAAKSRLAPPFDSDKPLLYNPGKLQTAIERIVGEAKSYKFIKFASAVAVFRCECEWHGEDKPRPFTVIVVKGFHPGEYLVEAVQEP